jgi:hypothetical protein
MTDDSCFTIPGGADYCSVFIIQAGFFATLFRLSWRDQSVMLFSTTVVLPKTPVSLHSLSQWLVYDQTGKGERGLVMGEPCKGRITMTERLPEVDRPLKQPRDIPEVLQQNDSDRL